MFFGGYNAFCCCVLLLLQTGAYLLQPYFKKLDLLKVKLTEVLECLREHVRLFGLEWTGQGS